jgi:hypothetical protein
MKTLVARIKGGLGNQLFMYAAARRLAIANGMELVLDSVTGFERDSYGRHFALDHFKLPARRADRRDRLEPFGRLRRGLRKRVARHRPLGAGRYIEQRGREFSPGLLETRLQRSTYIEGYWQDERYFVDIRDQIRDDLRLDGSQDPRSAQTARAIAAGPAVAVHVRWFARPPAESTEWDFGGGYYHRAIEAVERAFGKPVYFLFSDDPEAAAKVVPIPQDRLTIVDHNEGDAGAALDLWLMSLCDHFIIANSTFSWWGAWLGEKPGSRVYAPSPARLGDPRWPEAIVPPRWLTI